MGGAGLNFTKLLVANRGEIAVRVLRTARALGYQTAAVYSEVDSDALHVRLADSAALIGEAAPASSYLSVERIIDAAKRLGADAIHPGYGFLSERGEFADACAAAGIVFVGPPANAIRLMGDKRAAKERMIAAGVPTVPGYLGTVADRELLREATRQIGFPILIKASAGGGGRGMRVARSESELPGMLEAARSEASNAFGDSTVYLERFISDARHIEIQIFADSHGSVVYFGERECSIQRRHQKIIEESPSPNVSPALRRRMGEEAVNAARAIGYVGAGTVEFLVSGEEFFFMEMNTRLQVEHPVTELVSGVDLVEWQLRVARGETLPLRQNQIRISGHAIEARLYAEDPDNGYLPQVGSVLKWRPSSEKGVRVDSGIREGQAITAHYDPLLAKIVTHSPCRSDALRLMERALADTIVIGVITNKNFLHRLVQHPHIRSGAATTSFLAVTPTELNGPHRPAVLAVLAAVVMSSATASDPLAWQHALDGAWMLRFAKPQATEVRISRSRDGILGEVDDQRFKIRVRRSQPGELSVEVDGVLMHVMFALTPTGVIVDALGHYAEFESTSAAAAVDESLTEGTIVAPMTGKIVQVMVSSGDSVVRGQPVLVLEAMKMELTVSATCDGTMTSVIAQRGQQVRIGTLLAEIEINGQVKV